MNEMMPISNYNAYDVTIDWFGKDTYHVIAQSRSGAVYQAFQEGEYLEYLPFGDFIKNKDITKSVKKLHNAHLSDLFTSCYTIENIKRYKGMQFLELGMRVVCSEGSGFVVSSNESGNLKVFLSDSNKTCIIHPTWKTRYYYEDGTIAADYCN